jgi:hypothetical protein
VRITFIKSNNNSSVLQQMLKILPSRPNALSVPAEHVVVVVAGLHPRKVMKYRGGCFSVIPECGDLFYTFYLLTLRTNKSHKSLNQGNVRAKDHG